MTGSTDAVCVIQARMGSTRLPGKVMRPLDGQPMLGFMLDRLARLDVPVVVATSDLPRDQEIVDYVEARGVAVVRGSEEDVLGRYGLALQLHPAAHIIRLTADCPLADAAVVSEVLARHVEDEADYTSNIHPRSFPHGLDVEVVRAEAFRVADREATHRFEREHVTPFFYRSSERFELACHRSATYHGGHRWTVDTMDDLVTVRGLVERARAEGDIARLPWERLLAYSTISETAGGVRLVPVCDDDRERVRAWSEGTDVVYLGGVDDPLGRFEWVDPAQVSPIRQIFWITDASGGSRGVVRLDVRGTTAQVRMLVRSTDTMGPGLAALVDLVGTGYQIDRLTLDVGQLGSAAEHEWESIGFHSVDPSSGHTVVWTAARAS